MRLLSVFLTLALFCVPKAYANIVISELLWGGSDLSTADEWLELTNTGSGQSLSGWTLTKLSSGNETDMLTLPKDTYIQSGGTLLIANYPKERSRLDIDPDVVDTAVSLANTKLLIRLYTASGVLVDTVDDGVGKPFAGSNDTKASMERISLTASGSTKDNWQTATTFLHFDDGAPLFGTPNAPNGTGYTVDLFPPKEATSFNAELFSGSLLVTWVPSISLDLAEQELSFSGTGILLPASATGVTLPSLGTGITLILRSTDASGNTSSGITTISQLFPNINITEVLANPKGKDDEEWIEVGNLGREAVDLNGWILDEGNSSSHYVITDLILESQEHIAFPKSQTNLPLGNKGEEVSLSRGGTIMDSWTYPETAEDVSYGRTHEGTFQSFCVPTKGKLNTIIAPDPRIILQSGALSGTERVSVNLTADILTGSLVHAQCTWDYADGFTSDSCNPPSHSFTHPGDFVIRLTHTDFCGTVTERTVTVHIEAPEQSSGGSRGGGGSTEGNRTSCRPTFSEGVRISEILPNPEGKDEEGEWIELENTLDQTVDLCGWSIDDEEEGSKPFSLDTYRVAAKQFLVLQRESTKIALNNTGDVVRLIMNNTLLEEVPYEGGPEGKSYARKDDAFFWTIPTPNLTNRFPEEDISQETETSENHTDELNIASGALTLSALSYSADIIFSEVMSNPPKEGPLHDLGEYIELFNTGNTEVSLQGWVLDDNPEGSSKPFTFADVSLSPGTYAMLCSSCDLPLKVSLNNEGEELSLTAPDGSTGTTITYPTLQRGEAYALTNDWHITMLPTPGDRNVMRMSHIKKNTTKSKKAVKRTTRVSAPPDPLSALRLQYRPLLAKHTEERILPPLLNTLLAQTTPSVIEEEHIPWPLTAPLALFLFSVPLAGYTRRRRIL